MTDKKCPKCKSPIVGEGKFCVKCGFDFSQDSSVSKTTETSEISKTTTSKIKESKPKNKKKIVKVSIISGVVVVVLIAIAFILKAFFVPDYTGMSIEEMNDTISSKFYSVQYYKVSNSEDIGYIYEQSIEPGSFNFSCDDVELKYGVE